MERNARPGYVAGPLAGIGCSRLSTHLTARCLALPHARQSTDTDQSQGMFPSSIYDPKAKAFEPLLGDCGIHDCKNAFCSGGRRRIALA